MKVFGHTYCRILCLVLILYINCVSTEEKNPTKIEENVPTDKTELKIEVLKGAMGECQRKSQNRDLIFMHYTGYFENGTKFDSSVDKPGAQPISFQLGIGQVIKGWEQGLLDMCVGEKRKLHIPSHLAYDKKGAGVIPPDTNLVFETEIVQITDGPPPMNVFRMIDIDGDLHITIEEAALYLSRQAIAQRVPDNIAVHHNKQQLAQLFTTDDKNNDGRVSYDEFSGPKVDPPPHDEL